MQGSAKINAHCTAGIKVFYNALNQIKIIYTKTNYGHECSLGYLPIPKQLRQQIASDLVKGISFDKILDGVRDSIGSSLDRSHLVAKNDLYNIEKSYNIRKIERHKDDAMSVHLWVQECIVERNNPILLYKPQGQRIAEVRVNQGLGEHDFVLALQTPLQKELLQKCGHKRIVCVDATHGTNSYDFLLLTVLVVDELGEGFPVAWCYSNKEDSTAITIFFQHLRDRVGNIEPAWFMSDDASQYYSGWCTVFGGSPKKLLCSWHVDRAWRNAVSRHINNKQLQIEVYHTLRVLFEERNCEQFQVLLNSALQQWQQDPELKYFYQYFVNEYTKRCSEWALSYQKKAGVNTNMYLESFH